MSESTISLSEPDLVLPLFGTRDQHLHLIRRSLGVTITHRNGEIRVRGKDPAVVQATEVLEQLKACAERKESITSLEVSHLLARITGQKQHLAESPIDVIEAARQIQPRTPGQARYVQAIRGNDLTFAVGPAGTGKTYLAVALSVEALKQQTVRKIVLVRPAVEAGENLGFLPGDMQSKINPYLRPLLDALREMIDHEQIRQFMEQQVIEVLPLAYMRGRTLNNAFIILDEAQNSTIAQMKMFLTRMGEHSKIVVSGDVTQIDLPTPSRSGLTDALKRLQKIPGIAQIQLHKSDIVRHPLVQKIVEAYEDQAPTQTNKKRRHTR
ncbi:MAG TPA: PhoH family protein [Planctomycetaceae bacterium]|nr:PhoH family protein [Planctomycetaceae bacterium]